MGRGGGEAGVGRREEGGGGELSTSFTRSGVVRGRLRNPRDLPEAHISAFTGAGGSPAPSEARPSGRGPACDQLMAIAAGPGPCVCALRPRAATQRSLRVSAKH